ncbi:hypothetical protein VE02_09348 [Pseudogymnoascus sp. 03VT05]|nr:hypothetical protein VE02_09348 [Pseudogymnoascus sp. 03VT05]
MDASLPRTDLQRWRLKSTEGVHHWFYLSEEQAKKQQQSVAERYFLGYPTGAPTLPTPESFTDTALNGYSFFQRLQLEDGHWGCDYGGPSFLLPGLVFAMYITGYKIPTEWKIEMKRYLANHVNADGGWGMHLEGTTTVFATALYYVVLRILDVEKDHPLATGARERLLKLGGAIGAPQWGKYWLSTLNLYEWEGVNPVPPEFWLLPDWVPFHPWRWWVQCRVVYLPTSYLYANKCKMPLNPLLMELREEIYVLPYSSIDFVANSSTVAATDLKRPYTPLVRVMSTVMRAWEIYLRPSWLHNQANAAVRDLIRREDENTSYNDLAPVNKAFHTVVTHFADGGDRTAVRRHWAKLTTYLWQSRDGMTSGGTNGVQLWDTAFTVIAVAEAGLARTPEFKDTMQKALEFIELSQFQEDLKDPYRQKRKGGWPFSTKDNGYIVSDCSAEGMKATILLQEVYGFPKLISDSRLQDCVDTLLKMQNKDGGFGSYEEARGSELMELLNPAEVFDRIMVEYSYPECTTAVLTSLSHFRKHFPTYRRDSIQKAITVATDYITNVQRPDGSWYGSWAICFTYGTFFALESLASVGQTYQTSERVRRACDWLVSKQMKDGGWGEHYSSCEVAEYVQHEKSQVVNTAWATLALMNARYPHAEVIEKGLQLIKIRQLPNGEWLQESIEGVFNRTCMIGYPNYKFYFPIRALGRYEHDY